MTEKEYKDIAENIRAYRLARGLTQEQMAERLYIDTQYYAQLEQGRRHFTLERIVDSCRILNASIEDIVKLDFDKKDTSKIVESISSRLKGADYKELLIVERIVRNIII